MIRKCTKCYHYSACSRNEVCHLFKDESLVVELKQGHWDIHTDEYDCEYMKCSVCGEEFYPVDEDTVDKTYNYCPNCGAKMKEVCKE